MAKIARRTWPSFRTSGCRCAFEPHDRRLVLDRERLLAPPPTAAAGGKVRGRGPRTSIRPITHWPPKSIWAWPLLPSARWRSAGASLWVVEPRPGANEEVVGDDERHEPEENRRPPVPIAKPRPRHVAE